MKTTTDTPNGRSIGDSTKQENDHTPEHATAEDKKQTYENAGDNDTLGRRQATPGHSGRAIPENITPGNGISRSSTRIRDTQDNSVQGHGDGTLPNRIVNKGVTCYVNAMVQALSRFKEYHTACPELPGLPAAFKNLMRQMSRKQRSAIDPTFFLGHLFAAMRDADSNFNPSQQQDVMDALAVLMEAVNSRSRQAQHLTEIDVRSRVNTCCSCGHNSIKITHERCLLVPVRQSLTQFIEEFSPEEILEGENKYKCPGATQCKDQHDALS